MKFGSILFLIVAFSGISPVIAQTDNSIGNWDVFVLKGQISQKYFFSGEFNVRKSPLRPVYDYSEYKLLFGQNLTKNWSLGLGTGYYTSSLAGDFLTSPLRKEYRIWLDILFKNSWSRLYFDHRVRVEQRFHPSAGAPNRLRYRPALTVPVNHFKVTKNTFFLTSSNDTYFGTRVPRLEMIMFFLGGGYRFNDRFTLNAGNMHNYDFRKTTGRSRDYLYLTFIYNLPARKHTENRESFHDGVSASQ